jgi:phage protein U
METITIHNIKPATKKTGEEIKGVSKNGNNWQLYKVNNQYSYFHYGEEAPDFEIGESYDFNVEEQVSGEFINYTISLPRAGDEKTEKVSDAKKTIAGLQDRVSKLESDFKLLKEFLNQ